MNRRKGQWRAAACTLLVHTAVLVFLLLFYIRRPEVQEEGGVPVMLGNAQQSQGWFDPATMTEVEIAPENRLPAEQTIPETADQELMTQQEEPTVAIPPEKKKTVKPREKSEADKRAEAERAAAQAAGNRVAGAFGKGSKMGDSGSGTTGKGTEGSVAGNASAGKPDGSGGYGSFDLVY